MLCGQLTAVSLSVACCDYFMIEKSLAAFATSWG
jgi:hypothetical protein